MYDFIVMFLTWLAHTVDQTDGFRDTLINVNFEAIWNGIQQSAHAPYCVAGNGDDMNYAENVFMYFLNLLATGLGHAEVVFEYDCWQ